MWVRIVVGRGLASVGLGFALGGGVLGVLIRSESVNSFSVVFVGIGVYVWWVVVSADDAEEGGVEFCSGHGRNVEGIADISMRAVGSAVR